MSREAQRVFLDNKDIFYMPEDSLTRADDKKFAIR